ncbi:hypothetical protein Hanom_Chr14g01281881 [Helianthus anomalus]
MSSMGEMYKYMGISVPPRPSPCVYPDQGPFFTQQPDPSTPSFTQLISSMQMCLRPVLYSAQPFHAKFSSVRPNHAAISSVRPFHAGFRHVLYVAQPVTLY